MKQVVYNSFYGSSNGVIAAAITALSFVCIYSIVELLFSNETGLLRLFEATALILLYGPGFAIALGIFVGIPLGGLLGLLSPSGKTTALALVFTFVSGGLPVLLFWFLAWNDFIAGPAWRENQSMNLLYLIVSIWVILLGGIIGGSLGGYYFRYKLRKLTR